MTPLAYLRALVLALLISCNIAAPARAQTAPAQTIWRLLDYMAVDYGGAVADGRVVNPAEYKEMIEFAGSARSRMAELPESPARAGLVRDAEALAAAITAKADPNVVGASAKRLAAALLAAYPVPLGPAAPPDMARADKLYASNCASCHGADGRADTATARALEPAPIAFTDVGRARQRSAFALYQVIEQGIDGTAMQSFDVLPAEDRWALALYAGQFAFPDAAAKEGERVWKSDVALRQRIPDLSALAGLTSGTLAATIGTREADAVIAYLRRHPEAVVQAAPGSLSVAREKLWGALAAYRAGDGHAARELALSGYLDGFEPLEPMLAARDAALMGRVEEAMGEVRSAIQRRLPADEVAARVQVLDSLFDDAEAVLAPDVGTDASTFAGAFTILLREGVEALLVVVAMIAFLRKAKREEVLPYVHAGWAGALIAGVATWAVATYVIRVSGASRELTEGFGSIFAAVVLLSVGIWMHGKAQADQWRRYIREKMSKALSGKSAWFLFGLAFLVAYREVFETILFFAALWTEGNGGTLLAGAGSAVLLLGVIAWAMLRYSRQLPIAKFFSYSAWLMALLTIVLAGKGVAALQEAGTIDVRPVYLVPRIDMLGLVPTVESILAQLAALGVILLGFGYNRRAAARAASLRRSPG